MRVLYKYMRYVENNKYYVSLMIFNNKKCNNNVMNIFLLVACCLASETIGFIAGITAVIFFIHDEKERKNE